MMVVERGSKKTSQGEQNNIQHGEKREIVAFSDEPEGKDLASVFQEEPSQRNRSNSEEHVPDGIIYDRPRDPPGQRSVYVPPGNEKQESYRLSTFSKFPSEVPVIPRDLAAAGFYYTGYKDRVKCFSCGLCVENWVVGDDVKHARWHRNICDFANGRECGNIPIGGGIFSRFLNRPRGTDVSEANRQAIQPAVPPVRARIPSSSENVEIPMDEGSSNSNVSSTQTATSVMQPSRFLGSNFQFATINSVEFENNLRAMDLKMERNRLYTFANWNGRTVTPEDLAKCGFFYLGNLDRVQCFSCSGVLRNWTHGDSVDNEHRRHFAHCKMVRGVESTNVPMSPVESQPPQRNVCFQEPADPDPSQMPGLREMFPCQHPVNPHMQTETRRLETFDQRWTGNITATPLQISRAGFFFLGERDRVKCWYCNGGLQNWDVDDEPWTEHAKWFPTCEFILQRKGPDFVHRIVAAFPNLRRPTIRGGYDIPPNEEMGPRYGNGPRLPSPPPPIIDPQEEMRRIQQKVESAMRSENVRNVLRMGFTEQSVKRALKSKITANGAEYGSVDELLDALNNQNSDSEEEEPQPGIQLASGQTRVNITGSVANNLVIGGRRIQTGNNMPTTSQTTAVKQAISSTGRTSPMDIDPSENPSLATSEEQTPSMQKRLRELQEERMCKVCLDRPADIVFVPCGHLCCCYNCATALRKCPMCRKKIDKSIRTYMS